eukprot:COSAG01_NODE_847_length_13139_cov_35.539647_4_plen_117_part_00
MEHAPPPPPLTHTVHAPGDLTSMRKFLQLVQDKAQELRQLQQEPAPGGRRCGYEQRKKKRTERANKSKKKQMVEVQLQGGEELGGREGLPGGGGAGGITAPTASCPASGWMVAGPD